MSDRTEPTATAPERLTRPDGGFIAHRRVAGQGPCVVFCGGYRSDMTGSKAQMLEERCRMAGRAFVRFDYFGHGASSGDFRDGTIGRWRDDALAVIDAVAEGPVVLIGSSMGGWIALLAALARPQRVRGLVGLAAAPDFTERLMWDQFDEEVRATLRRDGVYLEPSAYDPEPYPITLRLIEEGRDHLLLDRPIALSCPVRLIQGMADPDVPWPHALALVEALAGADVQLTLVKDAEHRLSRPADLDLIWQTVDAVWQAAQSSGPAATMAASPSR